MLRLPPTWTQLSARDLIGDLLSSSRSLGSYSPLACGLTFAYLSHCIGTSPISVKVSKRLHDGNIVRANDTEWHVLGGETDDDLIWALTSIDRKVATTVVAPPWAANHIASALGVQRTTRNVSVTTLKSMIGLHALFVTGAQRCGETAVLQEIISLHNDFCIFRGVPAAIIKP